MTKFTFGFLLCVGFINLCSTSLPAEEEPAAARVPVPNDAALKEAQELVAEVYADDITQAKTPQAKVGLAKKLLKAAIDTKNDAAGRYVLLGMARDIATRVGDAETAFASIAELEQYVIDALIMKVEVLLYLPKSARDQDAKALVDRINPLLDEAVLADRYDVAKQYAELAVTAAKATKDFDCIKAANWRVQELKVADLEYQQVKKALAIITDNPKDPQANLLVGRYYCFAKCHWEKGLPMLALGSDVALRALAEKELAKPTEADKQVELGDGWWALAEKVVGAAKGRIKGRAAYWYEKAVPTLTGLAKAKVEKRLGEIGPSVPTKTVMTPAEFLKAFDTAATGSTWKVEGDHVVGRFGGVESAKGYVAANRMANTASLEFGFKIKSKWYQGIFVEIDGKQYKYSRGGWWNTDSGLFVGVKEAEKHFFLADEKRVGGTVTSPDKWCNLWLIVANGEVNFYYDTELVATAKAETRSDSAIVVGISSHTDVAIKDVYITLPSKVNIDSPPVEDGLSVLNGKWLITYASGAHRVYEIIDGKVLFTSERRKGKAERTGNRYVLDFEDGKIETIGVKDGKLFLQQFNPASSYPNGKPNTTGVGEKVR